MNPRWPATVDLQWQRAESLLGLLDAADEAVRQSLHQALLWQLEYAAVCYAAECVSGNPPAALQPELLVGNRDRRWQEFASATEPLLRACEQLRRPASLRSGGGFNNPLFATEEAPSALIARAAMPVDVLTPSELRALVMSARQIMQRQREEAEEF